MIRPVVPVARDVGGVSVEGVVGEQAGRQVIGLQAGESKESQNTAKQGHDLVRKFFAQVDSHLSVHTRARLEPSAWAAGKRRVFSRAYDIIQKGL